LSRKISDEFQQQHVPQLSAEAVQLAVRDDLPDLCLNDRSVITDKVERAFASGELERCYSTTLADLELEHHLSWFAKYQPEKLAELAARYRLTCLDFDEVGPALHFANQLPYSSEIVAPTDLLGKAKSWAERKYAGTERRLRWSLLQLHVLAFTCFTETELKEWLVFASERKPPFREIHFFPIPILCPLLLPDAVALFAREQARRYCDDPADESEVIESQFDFWANVGGLGGQPDAEYHNWVNEQLRQRNPTADRRYQWLLLWY
jgi:hypothetical protein